MLSLSPPHPSCWPQSTSPPPPHTFSCATASWRGCSWRVPIRPRRAARSHTGGWWWRSPGRGCAAPWRWCGCSHKWRPRCSTPPIQHPPTLSQWARPWRGPPAAGRWPQTLLLLLIGPTALQREKRVTHAGRMEALCGQNSASKPVITATHL